jgi:methylmalonyl-CoA/ethylmalonyl-CoA epimerase
MAQVNKINHIAIAVNDINEALPFWTEVLGLKLDHTEDVPSQKASVAFLPVGESEVELVQPTSPDTGTAKFLADRGPGMHHLCLEVDNIEDMLAQLKTKGVRLINETPLEFKGRRMAFVHPKSSGGVLIELYQLI